MNYFFLQYRSLFLLMFSAVSILNSMNLSNNIDSRDYNPASVGKKLLSDLCFNDCAKQQAYRSPQGLLYPGTWKNGKTIHQILSHRNNNDPQCFFNELGIYPFQLIEKAWGYIANQKFEHYLKFDFDLMQSSDKKEASMAVYIVYMTDNTENPLIIGNVQDQTGSWRPTSYLMLKMCGKSVLDAFPCLLTSSQYTQLHGMRRFYTNLITRTINPFTTIDEELGRCKSPQKIIYKNLYRIEHILSHGISNDAKSEHGVFNFQGTQIIDCIDDAVTIVKHRDSSLFINGAIENKDILSCMPYDQNDEIFSMQTIAFSYYIVKMPYLIGRARSKELPDQEIDTPYIKIIMANNKYIVTAYPYCPYKHELVTLSHPPLKNPTPSSCDIG